MHGSIARATAHFAALGLQSNIVVLLHGKMTQAQRERACKKNKLRTDFIMRAVQWLCANNEKWSKQSISVDEFVRSLQNPTLVDN